MFIDLIKENVFTLEKARSWYRVESMTDADYADDLALLTNTSAQAESLLHSLEKAEGGINLYLKTNKTEYMCF